MKKFFLLLFCMMLIDQWIFAQEEDPTEEKGFKKENFFTGGSVSLSFFNQSFLIGVNPVFGYSLAKWVDLGLVVNYSYASYRDYSVFDDRLKQSIYGGGLFTRLFPVHFIFAQAQVEHNWIRVKYLPPNNGPSIVDDVSANSFLVGAGYTTGRDKYNKTVYGYLAVLFDLSNNTNSPYTDNAGRSIPIIRAGINIPLFQGRGDR